MDAFSFGVDTAGALAFFSRVFPRGVRFLSQLGGLLASRLCAGVRGAAALNERGYLFKPFLYRGEIRNDEVEIGLVGRVVGMLKEDEGSRGLGVDEGDCVVAADGLEVRHDDGVWFFG